MLKSIKVILGAGILTLGIGCLSDAERDNTLDIMADNYQPEGQLYGSVTSFYRTTFGISGAEILLMPENTVTTSADDGSFIFENLQPGNYKLICSKDGYRSDTIWTDLSADRKEIYFRLNAVPAFSQVEVNTHHVSRWFPAEDTYYLSLKIRIHDEDGINEIDSVWVSIPSISFAETLFISNLNGTYEQTITEDQLPLSSLRQLEGKSIFLFCRDMVKNIARSEAIFLPRLIQDVPQQISPTGLQIITSFPLKFEWEPVFLPYDFSYEIEIYQINFGFFSRISQFSEITSAQTEYLLTTPLPAGDYFWLLYVVDEYGDSSSSKEGAFRIQ